MYNILADGWENGKYCMKQNLGTRECAEKWAQYYRDTYEGKPYPNGKGWYKCKNFRVVKVGGRRDHHGTSNIADRSCELQ